MNRKLVGACLIVGAAVALLVFFLSQRSRVELAHEANIDALHLYYHGSVEEASNALIKSIELLEDSRVDAEGKYYFDLMIFVSRVKLANIYLASSNEVAACHELTLAYAEHALVRSRSGLGPIPRDKFVPYAFESMEEVDSPIGGSWMAGSTISSNAMDSLNRMFSRLNGDTPTNAIK